MTTTKSSERHTILGASVVRSILLHQYSAYRVIMFITRFSDPAIISGMHTKSPVSFCSLVLPGADSDINVPWITLHPWWHCPFCLSQQAVPAGWTITIQTLVVPYKSSQPREGNDRAHCRAWYRINISCTLSHKTMDKTVQKKIISFSNQGSSFFRCYPPIISSLHRYFVLCPPSNLPPVFRDRPISPKVPNHDPRWFIAGPRTRWRCLVVRYLFPLHPFSPPFSSSDLITAHPCECSGRHRSTLYIQPWLVASTHQ